MVTAATRGKPMTESTIGSAKMESAAAEPKGKRKPADKKPADKKAELIGWMKRAKGVTLAEIVEATGWQKHTVRGFVSILGSKGGIGGSNDSTNRYR